MTIMTSMDGITAPARRAAENAAARDLPAETFTPGAELEFCASRRADGWSAANQRTFLERLAEGHGVEVAASAVGLSVASAYAFRRTAKGAAFALGWRAATLVARDAVAETLMVRALDGQVETVIRGEVTITRHRYDNALAMRLLARLDRQLESAPDADVKAARLVAQEFDAFLDNLEADDGPARAGLFLARRGGAGEGAPGRDGPDARDLAPIYALAAADRLVRTGVATAGEVDVADLDPAQRASWTAEQWARAEAAGLLTLAAPAVAEALVAEETAPPPQHSQHSPVATLAAALDAGHEVWFDAEHHGYRTNFPPPADYDGCEYGDYGDDDYYRELSLEEQDLVDRAANCLEDDDRAERSVDREAWFAALTAALEETEAALAAADALQLVTPAQAGVSGNEDATPAKTPASPPKKRKPRATPATAD